MIISERDLRKEWLKHKFISYDYHEELLKLHEEYLQTLKHHWARPEIQKKYPDIYDVMVSLIFYNFDMITKPGVINRSSWNKGSKASTANSITYNFTRGLGDMGASFNECAGMSKLEQDQLNTAMWKILRMSENITNTVDKRWFDPETGNDDAILNEEFTGPIDYPANWKEDISAALGLSTEGHPRGADARCEANQPCPRTGLWWTPAKSGSRRYFQEGEAMPDYPDSQYGKTIWYWDQNQA